MSPTSAGKHHRQRQWPVPESPRRRLRRRPRRRHLFLLHHGCAEYAFAQIRFSPKPDRHTRLPLPRGAQLGHSAWRVRRQAARHVGDRRRFIHAPHGIVRRLSSFHDARLTNFVSAIPSRRPTPHSLTRTRRPSSGPRWRTSKPTTALRATPRRAPTSYTETSSSQLGSSSAATMRRVSPRHFRLPCTGTLTRPLIAARALVGHLLEPDPKERYTAHEGLCSRWISGSRKELGELYAKVVLGRFA